MEEMTTLRQVTLKGGPLDGKQVEVDSDYYLSPETDEHGRGALYQEFDGFEFVMMTEDYCRAKAAEVLRECCPDGYTFDDFCRAARIADLRWKLSQETRSLTLDAKIRFAQSRIGQRVAVIVHGGLFDGGILTSQDFDTCTIEMPGGLRMERVPVSTLCWWDDKGNPL